MLLFFIIFIGLIVSFALYFIKLYREDKKIIDNYKSREDKANQDDRLTSDKLDITEDDKLYIYGERPFIPYIESWN